MEIEIPTGLSAEEEKRFVKNVAISSDAKGFISRLQEAKAPLDKKRTALQQKIKAIRESAREAEAKLKSGVKELHQEIRNYDELMSSALAISGMKDLDIAEIAMAKLADKVGEV